MRTTYRAATALLLGILASGCGIEELVMGVVVGEPETPIPGSIPAGAARLKGEMPGITSEVTLSFYTPTGVVIEPLQLNVDYAANPATWTAVLPVNQHHFNVRVVSDGGGVIRKAIVADPYAEEITTAPPLDAESTTLALALEMKLPASGDAATPTPAGPTPTATEAPATPTGTPTDTPSGGTPAPRVAPHASGQPGLGAFPCEGVDTFFEALRGQIATGSGPAALLFAEVSDELSAGATTWPAVVSSPGDLDETVGPLAAAAAASAPADGTLTPGSYRVIMGVVRSQGYPNFKCVPVDIDKWVNPSAGDRMFFTGGIHDDSPVQDPIIQNNVFPNWVPNMLPMSDDGLRGDEVAGDDIWTISFILPEGLRMGYKYTFGAQGENWTGTEEWPGNQRLMEVVDVNGDGYVARFDVFADEAANKDKQNAWAPDTTVDFTTDLNGDGYLEAQEQPADYIGGDCVRDGWWQPFTLPPVTDDGCF